MSLLTIVQNVMLEIGLPKPATAFTSDDKSVRQIIALANREGNELYSYNDWAVLQKRSTITLVAGQSVYNLPADFGRIINRTLWDTSNRWQGWGPMSPQEWEFIKSGITNVTIRVRWRIWGVGGNTLTIDPVPGVGDAGRVLAYEYISKNWCQSSGGTGQSAWAADTDTGILSEDLMTLGVKWRFLAAKQMAYADDIDAYKTERKNAAAQEKGASTLFTNSQGLYAGVPYPNHSEGNFG